MPSTGSATPFFLIGRLPVTLVEPSILWGSNSKPAGLWRYAGVLEKRQSLTTDASGAPEGLAKWISRPWMSQNC